MNKVSLLVFLAALAFVPALGAESAAAKSLSPEDAVKAALSGDARVEGAAWDLLAAQAKAKEAELRRLPALSLATSYTRLSDLQSSIDFGGRIISLSSLDNNFSLNANLQYPVFTGFRLEESAKLAAVQAQGKAITAEMIKRSLVFEVLRSYWEALRASNNVGMLKESRDLAVHSLEVVKPQLAQGTALRADLLNAEMRLNQAEMDLGAATNAQRKALLSLAVLVGAGSGASLDLNGKPEPVPDSRFPSLDAPELIRRALENRPETRASSLSAVSAELGYKLATAPLYPTVNLTGSYAFADPNPRVYFQSDPWKFTGTWSLGLSVSYDLGGLPANLSAREAQADSLAKSRSDDRRQRETVELDVRSCLLSFEQARTDYGIVSSMIDQALENERVTERRVAAGTASDLDLESAKMSRLKVEFSIANKLIDEQIAAADLERAAALASVE
jgi:outer membrane protein